MLRMDKILPPYSEPLYDLFVNDKRPNKFVRVFVGLLAWPHGFNNSQLFPERTIAIPPWNKPHKYFFPVDDCKVLIVDTHPDSTDMHYINKVAQALLACGASCVFFLYQVDTQVDLLTFKREF